MNIGNPGEFTIEECARAVLEVTGSKSELRFHPLPEDDPTRRCPDISKARALLGWEPRIPLKEGLERCLEFFKARLVPGPKRREHADKRGHRVRSCQACVRPHQRGTPPPTRTF